MIVRIVAATALANLTEIGSRTDRIVKGASFMLKVHFPCANRERMFMNHDRQPPLDPPPDRSAPHCASFFENLAPHPCVAPAKTSICSTSLPLSQFQARNSPSLHCVIGNTFIILLSLYHNRKNVTFAFITLCPAGNRKIEPIRIWRLFGGQLPALHDSLHPSRVRRSYISTQHDGQQTWLEGA